MKDPLSLLSLSSSFLRRPSPRGHSGAAAAAVGGDREWNTRGGEGAAARIDARGGGRPRIVKKRMGEVRVTAEDGTSFLVERQKGRKWKRGAVSFLSLSPLEGQAENFIP